MLRGGHNWLCAARLAGAGLFTVPGFYRTVILEPVLTTSGRRAEQQRLRSGLLRELLPPVLTCSPDSRRQTLAPRTLPWPPGSRARAAAAGPQLGSAAEPAPVSLSHSEEALPGSRFSSDRLQVVFTLGDSQAPKLSAETTFIAVVQGEGLSCFCERKQREKRGGGSGVGSERHRGWAWMVVSAV